TTRPLQARISRQAATKSGPIRGSSAAMAAASVAITVRALRMMASGLGSFGAGWAMRAFMEARVRERRRGRPRGRRCRFCARRIPLPWHIRILTSLPAPWCRFAHQLMVALARPRMERPMDPSRIQALIEHGLPGARVEVDGADGVHFEATVVASQFAGKLPLARHRLVYATLGDLMGGAIHALALKTLTPEEAGNRES